MGQTGEPACSRKSAGQGGRSKYSPGVNNSAEQMPDIMSTAETVSDIPGPNINNAVIHVLSASGRGSMSHSRGQALVVAPARLVPWRTLGGHGRSQPGGCRRRQRYSVVA